MWLFPKVSCCHHRNVFKEMMGEEEMNRREQAPKSVLPAVGSGWVLQGETIMCLEAGVFVPVAHMA